MSNIEPANNFEFCHDGSGSTRVVSRLCRIEKHHFAQWEITDKVYCVRVFACRSSCNCCCSSRFEWLSSLAKESPLYADFTRQRHLPWIVLTQLGDMLHDVPYHVYVNQIKSSQCFFFFLFSWFGFSLLI